MGSKKVVISAMCLILVLGISSCLADTDDIEDCGSVTGQIVKVELAGCEGEDRCPLKRGTNASMVATFKSNTNSKTLKTLVIGKLGLLKQKFNLPNPNACEMGVTCPISSGDTYTYTVSMPVKKNYPRVTVDIELHLIDENDKDVICALIPAKIVA
ncbi:NPC intracellular cholesterol transporter 2 homolog a [Diabrotica virgifera virgifera]|uniref:NPC intracellular cholesterol transporter 2 homolog a-like n=1 Tax=Diabrotica virgifera virgifera TaxID=50390 RepID=A0A6P7FN54_DIAVI|nr:NPC intracellular cholesterol transporter 2 homolog a [Diabrotica virgifera virgifera]